MATDDELAQTATAPASPAAARAATERPALGRFKLARELGAGGMGKVYEAHDPDLDRGVALKVLHSATSEDARARLLKEARAMAKLSHPNVITVFDVATHEGRDYIAMELIDGASLADWLKQPHTPREIIAAFVAAGRGLAAAHAAGIVHRDFKPHNVLRRKDGRIVVSDFGIAHRSASMRPSGSDLAFDKTATGTLTGTPAYMAPEQWTAGTVTPATDQFAFCVALWEALAGKRPFDGSSIDELRAAVLAGPDTLDDSALPRPVRRIIRRGLALDPAARWPAMDTLIARLERVLHRRRRAMLALALAAAATAVVVAVAFAALRGSGPVVDPCGQPAVSPDVVARTAATRGVTVVLAQLAAWRDVRKHACAAAPAERAGQLACLDGVLVRLADAANATGPTTPDALADELVDPAVCTHRPPPHLVAPLDPGLATAFAALRVAEKRKVADLAALIAAPESCARAVALTAKLAEHDWLDMNTSDMGRVMSLQEQLRAAADQCGDDGIKALAARNLVDADDPDTIERAEKVLPLLDTELNRATLDEAHGSVALVARDFDRALDLFEQARIRHHAAGRIRAELSVIDESLRARLRRGRPDDLMAVIATAKQWVPQAQKTWPLVANRLQTEEAKALWRSGDVEGGDALATDGAPELRAEQAQIQTVVPGTDVDGIVEDERGQPVANTQVVGGPLLFSDSARLASPVIGGVVQSAMTDGNGRFHLKDVRGFLLAGEGDRRSALVSAGANVRLVLAPTNRVSGSVELHDAQPGARWVVVRSVQRGAMRNAVIAPIRPDGTFEVQGVPRGRADFAVLPVDDFNFEAATVTNVDIDQPTVTGVKLESISGLSLVVVARSPDLTPPEMALVFAFRGVYPVKTIKLVDAAHRFGMWAAMLPARPASAVTAAQRGNARQDDLVGEMNVRPPGSLTVCATGLARKQLEGTSSTADMSELMQGAELGCAVVAPTERRVTLDLPPLRRRP